MKRVALALVGLSFSTASFAEPQIKAFCFENVKPNQKLTGYHGLFVGQMPLGSKLLLTSAASGDHSYHLKAFAKGGSSKNLRKLNVDKTSDKTFEVPAYLVDQHSSSNACSISGSSSAPMPSGQAQAQNQSQCQMQVKPLKPAPVVKTEVNAPTLWTEELPPPPAPVEAPKQCEKGKDQGPVVVPMPEQSQSQSQSQFQQHSQHQGAVCTFVPGRAPAQDQAPEQNCADTSQEQAQDQGPAQSQDCGQADVAQGAAQDAQQGSADQSLPEIAPAPVGAPEEVTVRLSNHLNGCQHLVDLKHTREATLKAGDKAVLSFNYAPGIFEFNHGGVDMVCEVEYLGDVQ